MSKILYVEDNTDTAEAVKIILAGAGHEIEVVNSGKDCLNIIKEKDFDLYLLDVMLPDMSGWDIFEKLKTTKTGKFAFLSAIPVSTDRMNELKRAGIVDYITKPFRKEDLINRVSAMLG